MLEVMAGITGALVLFRIVKLHPVVQQVIKTLHSPSWNILSHGSIWFDEWHNMLIIPMSRGAGRAYIRYGCYTHECSKLETFCLRMLARKAMEERK